MPNHASNQRVLVLDADMTPALSVTRSLGRQGILIDLASHESRALASHSRYAQNYRQYPDPLGAESDFRLWIEQQIAENRYQLIIPVTERSATALKPLLSNSVTRPFIALPDLDSFEIALDKNQTLSLAKELGIPTPKSWLIESLNDVDSISSDSGYPLVIKPARSIGDSGDKRQQLNVAYAHSAEELANKLKHYLLFGPVLVQQYIAGDGVGIELIAKQGETLLAFQHKRLHEVPLTGGGSSLRTSVELNPKLVEAAKHLMAKTKWHGVAMVEFKHNPNDDSFALMEINGRFWGSLPLSVAAGADFPFLLYELMTKGDVTQIPQVKIGVLARKLSSDLFWHELVLRRHGDPAIVHFPDKKALLKGLLLIFSPRHHFDVQQWSDPKPGLVDIGDILKSQWQRISELLHLRKLRKQQQRAWQQLINSGQLSNTKQILFLCYGNINRSAVAERQFQKLAPNKRTVKAISAGFHSVENRPADPVMCTIAKEADIDMSDWQSRRVSQQMVENSDLILVMEFAHRERLLKDYPEAGDKILLLGMVPENGNSSNEITDPYGHETKVYQQCFQQLSQCTSRLIKLI